MIIQEYSANQFRQWNGGIVNAPSGEINAPSIIGDIWSNQELAAVGLYRPVSFIVPQGKVISGAPRYSRVGANIVETYTVVDAPPPSAEEIRVNAFNNDSNFQDLVNRIKAASVSDIDTWITANVTTLAQARIVLATIIKMLVIHWGRN